MKKTQHNLKMPPYHIYYHTQAIHILALHKHNVINTQKRNIILSFKFIHFNIENNLIICGTTDQYFQIDGFMQ